MTHTQPITAQSPAGPVLVRSFLLIHALRYLSASDHLMVVQLSHSIPQFSSQGIPMGRNV